MEPDHNLTRTNNDMDAGAHTSEFTNECMKMHCCTT